MKNKVTIIVSSLLVVVALSSSASSFSRSRSLSSSRPVFRFPERRGSAQSSSSLQTAQKQNASSAFKRVLTKEQIRDGEKRKKQYEDILKKLKAIQDRAKKYQNTQSSKKSV